MKSQAFVGDLEKRICLREVILPNPKPEDIVVRTICSAVSIGTESLWLHENSEEGQGPIALGYQAVGSIEQLGDQVQNLGIGDTVIYSGSSAMSDAADGTAIKVRQVLMPSMQSCLGKMPFRYPLGSTPHWPVSSSSLAPVSTAWIVHRSGWAIGWWCMVVVWLAWVWWQLRLCMVPKSLPLTGIRNACKRRGNWEPIT